MIAKIAKKNAIQDSKNCTQKMVSWIAKITKKNAKIEESFAILGSKTC